MGTTWRLTFVRPLKPIEGLSALVRLWEDLERKEAALRIEVGQPILLPPSGKPDLDVFRYLNSGFFRRLSKQTQSSYAKDLRLYFSFLESQQLNWRSARNGDLFNYEFWRRRDSDNPRRIGGAKFARELAAIDRFYKWQVKNKVIDNSPIERTEVRNRSGEVEKTVALTPRNVRRTNVKWLTPRAYRQWRDIGLGGYGREGLRDPTWRGRTDGRNVAFADLLWFTGLRLTEGATLLTLEVPPKSPGERFVRGRLSEAVAKGGAKRDFWVSNQVLDRIESYIEIDRRKAIDHAIEEGRYNELPGVLIAHKVTASRILHYETETGSRGQIPLDQINADLRRQIFVKRRNEIEPAFLWLTESGLPLPVDTWESVFKMANNRCARFGLQIYCHPHMLRHSFALKMLVTLIYVFERRMSLTPEERREYRMIFGDPWILVQTLLGHRSPEVTRNTYLEPVKGLQVDLFLNDSNGDCSTIDTLLAKIVSESPLVTDASEIWD